MDIIKFLDELYLDGLSADGDSLCYKEYGNDIFLSIVYDDHFATKKDLSNEIENFLNEKCDVCYNTSKRKIFCCVCNIPVCDECDLNIINQNEEHFKCPFCRSYEEYACQRKMLEVDSICSDHGVYMVSVQFPDVKKYLYPLVLDELLIEVEKKRVIRIINNIQDEADKEFMMNLIKNCE